MAATRLDVRSEGKTLFVGDHEIEFEAPITKVLEIRNKIVVRLNVDDLDDEDPMLERNVICVDQNARVLWRIERSEGPLDEGVPILNPYAGIGLNDDETGAVAYDMGGQCFDLDLETGAISNPIFTR